MTREEKAVWLKGEVLHHVAAIGALLDEHLNDDKDDPEYGHMPEITDGLIGRLIANVTYLNANDVKGE